MISGGVLAGERFVLQGRAKNRHAVYGYEGNEKKLLLVIAALIVSLAAGAYVAKAQSKPSVPEFTLELTDTSYDAPPSSSVNPYTGQTEIQPGYRVELRTIRFSIKNQPFTPFQVEDENDNNWTAELQYNIRWKGHFEQDWHEIYYPSDGFLRAQLESEYTVRSFEGEYSSTDGLSLNYQGFYTTFPPSAQLDFQVEAKIRYVHRLISIPVPGSGWLFTGESSGWSNTQTITIPEALPSSSGQTSTANPSSSPTQQPLPEPTQTNLLSYVLVAVAAVIIGFVAGILVTKLRYKNQKPS